MTQRARIGAGTARAVQVFVEQGARERAEAFGRAFREQDYVGGAIAVFYALGSQKHLPLNWVVGALAKYSPLTGVPYQQPPPIHVRVFRWEDGSVWAEAPPGTQITYLDYGYDHADPDAANEAETDAEGRSHVVWDLTPEESVG